MRDMDAKQPGEGSRKFSVGTLLYTRAGLISLFGWLLWGDFMFTLMEQVMPSLLPLLLRENGGSNSEVIFITSTLYLIMNSALNPVISYQSDRFRSRWGRRRPFIVATTPMVVLFLAAIPFAPEILGFLKSSDIFDLLIKVIPMSPIMIVFGILVAGFQVFNMFISSVYYYLIPDVVPAAFIGRFYGLFRVCGALAGMFFNYFIFGHAENHMHEIFVIISVIYGFFILLMCWRVKEGEYPPVIDEVRGNWFDGIRNYAKECFGSVYFWWVFLAYSAVGWGGAGSVFTVFYYRDELCLSLDAIGRMTAWSSFLYVLLAYPFGALMDRWGSHKTLIAGNALTVSFSILMFFFAVDAWSGVVWTLLRGLPLALASMALLKWTVDVYPSDRYGQFGSAAALFSSIGGIFAAAIYGWWLDWVKEYRYFLVWNAFFALIALVASIVVYRNWRVLRGSGPLKNE